MRILLLFRAAVLLAALALPAAELHAQNMNHPRAPYQAPGMGWALRAPAAPQADGFSTLAQPFATATYRVLVEGDPLRTAASVLSAGGKVLGVHDAVLHVEATREQLALLAADTAIAGLRISRRFRPSLDISRTLVHADTLNEGVGLARGFTGAGVIVAVVDTGIDIYHPDFRFPDGSTRLLYLWDQTFGFSDESQQPEGFAYGVVCSAEQINRQIRGATMACPTDDGKAISDIPTQGHGTHVAGIAAGSNAVYRGMAPDASLIVVRALFEEGRILDGVDWVIGKCEELRRPCVVNLSLGTTEGAHDGTSIIERELAKKTGPGRIIVAAAGNEADPNESLFTHARVPFTGTGGAASRIHGPLVRPGMGAENVGFSMLLDIWSRGTLNRAVYIAAMTPSPTGWTVHNPEKFLMPPTPGDAEDGMPESFEIRDQADRIRGYVHWVSAIDPANNRRQLLVAIDRCASAPCLADGTPNDAVHDFANTYWSFHFVDDQSGRLDFWPANVSAYFLGLPPTIQIAAWPGMAPAQYAFLSGDNASTITIPATHRDIIAVGSMVTRSEWTDVRGRTQPGISPGPLGALSGFSSRGPATDGRVKPDITAPGEWIASTHSSLDSQSPSVFLLTEEHKVLPGTSMAAPHVAGIIALMLERNPLLTPADLVGTNGSGLLTRNTQSNGFTGSLPNNDWGFGILDGARIFADPTLDGEPIAEASGPRIDSLRANAGDESLVVTWNTHEPADSLVTLAGEAARTGAERSYVKRHTIRFAKLSPGSYTVRVVSRNLAGKTTTRQTQVDVGGCGCMSRRGPGTGDAVFAGLFLLLALGLRVPLLRRKRLGTPQ